MALAHVDAARKHVHARTHDDANVNPFHDQMNSQYLVGSSEPPPPRPTDPPGVGTAGELRARRIRERKGSFSRARSEPPAEINSPSPPPAPPPPAQVQSPGHETDLDNIYEWNAERLDAMGEEVFTNIAPKILRIEWRLEEIDNPIATISGPADLPNQQSVRRPRYTMGAPSSPGSSPARTSPGHTSHDGAALATGTEQFAIGTPDAIRGPSAP